VPSKPRREAMKENRMINSIELCCCCFRSWPTVSWNDRFGLLSLLSQQLTKQPSFAMWWVMIISILLKQGWCLMIKILSNGHVPDGYRVSHACRGSLFDAHPPRRRSRHTSSWVNHRVIYSISGRSISSNTCQLRHRSPASIDNRVQFPVELSDLFDQLLQSARWTPGCLRWFQLSFERWHSARWSSTGSAVELQPATVGDANNPWWWQHTPPYHRPRRSLGFRSCRQRGLVGWQSCLRVPPSRLWTVSHTYRDIKAASEWFCSLVRHAVLTSPRDTIAIYSSRTQRIPILNCAKRIFRGSLWSLIWRTDHSLIVCSRACPKRRKYRPNSATDKPELDRVIHRHIIHANFYVIWLVSVYE